MSEIVTKIMSQESDPIIWSCLNLMRKGLGEDKIPTIMLAGKSELTKTGKPRPYLVSGFIPKIKSGSKAKPPIFRVNDNSKVEFYDFNWNLIDEAEYLKQMGAIDKSEFDYTDPNFTYNPYDQTYSIKGYKL